MVHDQCATRLTVNHPKGRQLLFVLGELARFFLHDILDHVVIRREPVSLGHPLGAVPHVDAGFAAAAMALSSVFVLFNALRLRWIAAAATA